jgi:hypothetical protein
MREALLEKEDVAKIDPATLIAAVRRLMRAAEERRILTYTEFREDVGISGEDTGRYLGAVCDFCSDHRMGPLNALVVSFRTMRPSDDSWMEVHGVDSWEEGLVSALREGKVVCRKGVNARIRDWLRA